MFRVLRSYRSAPSNVLARFLCTAKDVITNDPANNVSHAVAVKIGRKLHRQTGHPLNIIKERIECYFQESSALLGRPVFQVFDDLPPVVSVHDNFDSLLIPPDHVSRKPTDTYYVDANRVLRCHTSAHQTTLLRQGQDSFLVCGDVYRRDEVDRSHYPVFHQMEGVRVFRDEEISSDTDATRKVATARQDLKNGLEGLARHLFGDVEMRWVDAYFPFTTASTELEILFRGEWMEVLGCGVIEDKVMKNAGRQGEVGWAFGLGLERLAMVLFSIPDIRLFWSDDERFINQFEAGRITVFKPYSKYPPCYKDVSFWLPSENFHNNDMFEVVRDIAGDLVEEIQLVDEFVHPRTQRQSNCFRITYRCMDRSLTNQEIDKLQTDSSWQTISCYVTLNAFEELVRQSLTKELKVELR